MDKEIPQALRRRNKNRRLIKAGLLVAVMLGGLLAISLSIKTSVKKSDILSSIVDKGEIAVTVTANGTVVPIYEEIITSPLSSKIIAVYAQNGDVIEKGESLMELDLVAFTADRERFLQDIKVKKGKLELHNMNSKNEEADLQMQIRINELQLERLAVLLQTEIHMDSLGASMSDRVKQIELEYEVQKLKLDQLRLNLKNCRQVSEINMRDLTLDLKIAENNLKVNDKTMQEALVKSPRAATIIWINQQIGSNISQGSQLANIADLTSFKMNASTTDGYSDKIASGQRAEFMINNKKCTGTVGNISPSVQDGKINFEITIDDAGNKDLKTGLTTDVYIVNSVKDNVLRIRRRSFYYGPGKYNLWVLNGNKAVKREVLLGESGYEYVEVRSGLSEGETVIITDMNRYSNRNQIRISNN